MKNVLFIGDTQFPFEHQDYLAFCKAVAAKYDCKRIVHVGDIVDQYGFSDYGKHPEAMTPATEVKEVAKRFKQWGKVFPEVECVIGNHDIRIMRKLNSIGISDQLLSLEGVFRSLFKLPEKWSLNTDVRLSSRHYGDVIVLHGDEKGCRATPGSTMRLMGCNTVHGHRHSHSFIFFDKTRTGVRFDMLVGSGIDDKAIAYTYNKKDIRRPLLSCGVLVDGIPIIIPMVLKADGRWNRRIL